MDLPAVATRDDRPDHARRDLPVDLDGLADALARVLDAEGVPAEAEATLQLVAPDAIAELKAEHLDGDGAPTDVLSFPIDGVPAAGAPDLDAAGGWIVGDVVVCVEVAAAQAPDHAGTLDDELALLVVHGGLHLCGWDHADPDERAAMWDRERQLLAALGRTPTRDPWSDA